VQDVIPLLYHSFFSMSIRHGLVGNDDNRTHSALQTNHVGVGLTPTRGRG